MDQTSDDMSLKEVILKLIDWYQYFLSKWKILLLTVFLGATIGVIYAWIQKPIYTATITYALDDEKSGGSLSGALGIASSLGFDFSGSSAGGAFGASNLMELMHYRSVIEKTLLSEVMYEGKKTTLADLYIEVNDLRSEWIRKQELIDLHFRVETTRNHFSRIQDSVLGLIYTNIDKNQLSIIQKERLISIGTIEVKSVNELFAKLFCEALVKDVTELYIETKSRKARNNLDILQKQADSVRLELNNAITGVASANDNTFNLNSVLSVHKTIAAKRQVDVQANTAILTQLVANLEMAKVALLKETPLIQLIDRPILPLIKEKPRKLTGLIVGAFLAGFLSVLVLIFKRIWMTTMGK